MINNIFQYLKKALKTFAATFNLHDSLKKVQKLNPFYVVNN